MDEGLGTRSVSDPDHIEIVLIGLDELLSEAESAADQLTHAVDETTDRLTALERQLESLTGQTTPPASRSPDPTRKPPARAARSSRQAESLDDLFGEREAKAIERRFRRETTLRARLDRYDIIAAITAGLVATLVDRLLVRIPEQSNMTAWLRDHATTDDNWMSDLAKVPYDRVAGTGITGMGPNTHRAQTPGHDPLLGLIIGTSDIMHGRMTVTDPNGRLYRVASPIDGIESVVEALSTQILHLLSDVCTTSGLPIPGWAALTTNQMSVGGRPLATTAREMFIRGYDSWHLMTMSTTPASAEFGCRLYWGIRCATDPAFEQQTESVEDDPRYRSISLLAHGVAAACDAAQFAATGNPLALNWSQWMMFATDLAGWLKTTAPLPTAELAQQFKSNRAHLDSGWERVWAGTLPPPPSSAN